jgi:hypothetical protein
MYAGIVHYRAKRLVANRIVFHDNRRSMATDGANKIRYGTNKGRIIFPERAMQNNAKQQYRKRCSSAVFDGIVLGAVTLHVTVLLALV